MRSSRFLRVVIATALVLAGCDSGEGSDGNGAASIEGTWWLDSIEVDGVRQAIEFGVNTARQPWIEISDGIEGSLGCNHFGTEVFTLEENLLIVHEVVQTAALCGGPEGTDVMYAERLMTGFFTRPPGIHVELAIGPSGDDEMIWIDGPTRFTFVRYSSEPPPTTSPPLTSVGRLDCFPGTVVEERLGDMAIEAEQILFDSDPAIVRVEAGEPLWWWGLDASGEVVAALAEGDITPVQYQLWTCVE